jgi:hypothetical protein
MDQRRRRRPLKQFNHAEQDLRRHLAKKNKISSPLDDSGLLQWLDKVKGGIKQGQDARTPLERQIYDRLKNKSMCVA